jgi:murein DD-endopeptidase MepM/ murein hydrolase activator NlpD
VKQHSQHLPLLALALLSIPAAHAQRAKSTITCACLVSECNSAQVQQARVPLIAGTRISSGFGNRAHPIFGYAEVHFGVDIAAPSGTPVYVTASGVIEEAREKGTYGNYLFVRHSSIYGTAYAHLALFAPGIHPGVHVRGGQVIGYSGSSGLSSGPHLHFESWESGLRVDPMCSCDTSVSPPLIPNSSERPSLLPLVRAPSNH